MFAVIFEVNPRAEQWDAYLSYAASLRPELVTIDGFIANERYSSRTRPGWLVSLSLWRNEKALIRWRTHALHHEIQGKGRSSVFADYHLRVGEVTRDTSAASSVPPQRLDETEVGAAKAVTLTEYLPGAEPNLPGGGDDLVAWDVFESITRPGALLHLRSWRNVAAAEAVAPGGDVHRVVRIIRDYGMYSREEAPQHFPPVARSDEAGPSARATPAAGHSRNAQFAAPDGSAST